MPSEGRCDVTMRTPSKLRKGAFRREDFSRLARAISERFQGRRSDFRQGLRRYLCEPGDFWQPWTVDITRCLIILKEKVKAPQVPMASVGKSLRVVALMKTWVLMGKVLSLNVWWKG
ncbi:unnamed protein product [Prunus armeniaca]